MRCHWGVSHLSCWSFVGSRHFVGLPPSLPHFGARLGWITWPGSRFCQPCCLNSRLRSKQMGLGSVVTKVSLQLKLPRHKQDQCRAVPAVAQVYSHLPCSGEAGSCLETSQGPLGLHLGER